MAPRGLPIVLALKIATPLRPTNGVARPDKRFNRSIRVIN
jgi:hypothetical protein